jgi:hypothetical protein
MMKKNLVHCLSFLLIFSLIFSSCKKETAKENNNSNTELEIATHSDDESMVSEELDAILSDANAVVETDVTISGDASVLDQVICDATVAINKESDPMTITVSFNGENCGIKRNRTGVVVFSIAKGTEWKNEGAAITVSFQDFKVTRKADGKSITLNGSHIYTNVSGGLVYQTASQQPIIHTVSGTGLSIKFDDGTARTWNVSRKKTFTYDNGLVITVSGTHTEGEETKIAEWGTNRFGNSFTTSITAPVVVKQDCDFRVTGGGIKHKTEMFTATAEFGLNATGTATTCPGEGHYYYKLGWTKAGSADNFAVVLPY